MVLEISRNFVRILLLHTQISRTVRIHSEFVDIF